MSARGGDEGNYEPQLRQRIPPHLQPEFDPAYYDPDSGHQNMGHVIRTVMRPRDRVFDDGSGMKPVAERRSHRRPGRRGKMRAVDDPVRGPARRVQVSRTGGPPAASPLDRPAPVPPSDSDTKMDRMEALKAESGDVAERMSQSLTEDHERMKERRRSEGRGRGGRRKPKKAGKFVDFEALKKRGNFEEVSDFGEDGLT